MGIYYYLNEGFQKIIIYFLSEKLVVFLVLQMSGNKCNEDSEKCSFYFFWLRAKTLVFCAYSITLIKICIVFLLQKQCV